MYELGKRDQIPGAEKLKPLSHGMIGSDIKTDVEGKPTKLPILNESERVVAGFDHGPLGEKIIVCESLEDMQVIYNAFAQGGAKKLNWYKADDPGFVTPLRSDAE